MTNVETLRAGIAESRDAMGRARINAELRAAVVEYTLERRKSGLGLTDVAKELGVPKSSLSGWCRLQKKTASKRKRMVRVKVADRRGGISVHGPGGLRIEGLRLSELAELIRHLS